MISPDLQWFQGFGGGGGGAAPATGGGGGAAPAAEKKEGRRSRMILGETYRIVPP